MERDEKLSKQVQKHLERDIEESFKGNFDKVISTGSTLLDLAISAGVVRGGGIPGGILIEAFGPSGSGKTVLLCEMAGNVQRQDGDIMFKDPEARLNVPFAAQFGVHIKEGNYSRPSTVVETFADVRKWKPEGTGIHGIFADSLAALSTDLEMDNEKGDKMGGKRAKDFSEQLRKHCRYLAEQNYIMACSNQIRQNMDGGLFSPKYTTPGGMSFEFYASLRLRFMDVKKIEEEITYQGKLIKRIIGVTTTIQVAKSSIWKPYRSAPVTIIFDYGIDDIRQNLQFLKDYKKDYTVYCLNGSKLSNDMDKAIKLVETNNLETELRNEVIDLWEDIESKFDSNRKQKVYETR